jgi:peptide/nickel transport system substrate-binding protein
MKVTQNTPTFGRQRKDPFVTQNGITRRSALMGAMVAATLLSTSCTSAPGQSSAGHTTLTIAQVATSFVRNYNVISPSATRGPLANMIYEPLVQWTSGEKGMEVVPWLAKSFSWSDGGKTLTFNLRTDVKWSDGQPLTSKDVAYTYGLPLANKALNTGQNYTNVTTPDASTVVFDFPTTSFTSLQQFLGPVVPEHVWAPHGTDVAQFVNPDPVGTGPLKVDQFTAQQVTFAVNKDYWAGDLAMSTVKVVAGSQDSIRAGLSNGTVDWANVGWPNGDKGFVEPDPNNRKLWSVPGGGAQELIFNTAVAPFDDVHVRRAVAFALNREQISKVGDNGEPPASPTGLDQALMGDFVASAYRTPPGQNVDQAKSELAQSSYTLKDGTFVKDGKSTKVSLLIKSGGVGWSAYAAAIADQLKSQLGIVVDVQSREDSAFEKQLQVGDFSTAIRGLGGLFTLVPYNVTLNSQFYAPVGTPSSSNYVRWNDPETDALLKRLADVDPLSAEAKELGYQLQDLVVEKVPFTGLVRATEPVEINEKNWKGWPADPATAPAIPSPSAGVQAIINMLKLRPAS